jgi:hypothetical protein
MSAQRNRTQCPNLLQLQHARRGIAAPSKLQRLQSCKTGIIAQKGQKGLAGDSIGVSRRTFFSKYITSDRSFALLFAAPSQQEQQTVFRKKIRNRTPIKHQVSRGITILVFAE